MSTGNVDLSASVKIQSSVGFSSVSGKHGPRTKIKMKEHRRRRSGSRDSSAMYSLHEGRCLNKHQMNKHHVHKLAARTSESDLCLQGIQSGQQTDISSTLFSDSSIGKSSYNYDEIIKGKDMALSEREHKSDDPVRFEGFNRQSLEASEAYVNKLRKQAFDIVDCEESQNNFRRNSKEDRKPITDSAGLDKRCAEPDCNLKLSEGRVRSRSRNTCSASGYSCKSKERTVTKGSTHFDNHEHEKYKNGSSQQQKAIDLMRRSKRTTESDSVNFDTKNRGDSDVSFAASNGDFLSYNEGGLDCHGTYLDFDLKKQHSRQSRNYVNAEKNSRALGQKPFSCEEHAAEDTPTKTQVSRQQHENSRLLRKISDRYNYGETPGADKNVSYSQNFGCTEDVTSNPALTKQRLWEQTIMEESTISADTSKCPFSSLEEKVTDDLIRPSTRLVNLTQKPHSLINSDKPIIVQMSRGGQNKLCNDWLIGDWKWKKHFRKCSSALQKAAAYSNNENATDESTIHSRWRANAYGTGSSLDIVTTSSEDEAVGPSFWTCTKWTDGNSEDTFNQSHESQWAYEVYSDTCHKFPEHANKDGARNTCTQGCSQTPGFDHADKHAIVSQRDRADVYTCAGLVSSSLSERNRCPWQAHLDSLFDDKMKVKKLLDFTNMSRECLQSQGEELTKSNDSAATIVNKFNKDYMQRMSEVCQEKAGETNARMDSISLEKDTSSHNAKGTRNCDKTCPTLERANDVKQCNDKCLQNIGDINMLITKTLAIDNLGYDIRRSENISPRQTASSVDEKLMKTVHSIKEDIEDVLQMLSSLDSQDRAKDVAVTLLNETLPIGKPLTVDNVNCATDFVKQAFNKLIYFKNAILMQTNEQEDNSGRSYDEYRKGREDYIADPDVPDEEFDIQNIFSYKNIPRTADPTRAGLNFGIREKSIRKHYSEKLKTGKTSTKPKPRSPRRKKSVFEKVKLAKKATPLGDITPGGFDIDNRSVTEISPVTVSEGVGPSSPYKSHLAERPGKTIVTHLTPKLRGNGKQNQENSKQKERRPVVSNINGPSDLKHKGAGDRATLAFVSPNSKSRNGSPSPATNKDDRYAYGLYPLPTFLDSPDNKTAESKQSKRQMKITVEKVIPRRSSPEKNGSGRSKSKTSITGLKHQKTDSRTLPSKKLIGVHGNVSNVDLKRKRLSRSIDSGKKTTDILSNKSTTANLKKDKKKAQKFIAPSKGNNKMIGSKPSWKAPRHTQDRNERNSPSSNSESSPRVIGQDVSDTSPTVNADTSLLLDSMSREGTPGTDNFVNRYMVVSEMAETPTPGEQTVEVQGGQTQTQTPVVAEPEIATPSPSRRSRRLSRRTRSRSRSRSRIKKRKKNKLFFQRVSDTARFSSSDASLFKKSNHLTKGEMAEGSLLHNQDPPESLLRKSSAKGDKESWFHSETQKSPSVRVSQSDVDVAKSVKTKYRESSATGETIHVTEFYGNSSNATIETMAWPLARGYERAGVKRTPKSEPLVEAKDKKAQNVENTRVDMSTSELNVSIKKLYQEINKLRLQLEASAGEAMSRPMPKVDSEGPSKFARSYKVFTESSPKFPEPLYKYRQTPDFSYKKMSQTHSQPANSHLNSAFSETPNTQTRGENTPANCDRINEFMAILESRMRNIQSFDMNIINPGMLPNIEGVTESCADNRRNPASKDIPSSCNMEASQSVITARDISNWLNEDVYVTATCDATDNSDTQNDATEKFETAPSDNEYSSSNFKDAKPDETTVGTAACSSVNNNMRPTESGVCPEVITVYQKTTEDEKNFPSCKPGKSIRFQNSSTRMYEVSSEDVDKPAECYQQRSNCVDSSEKRDTHCLVELCSETSKRFRVGSVHASADSEPNACTKCDRRSRGQSTETWGKVIATALENTSQNKGSPTCGEMSEKLYGHLHPTPGTTVDNPTSSHKDTDLDQTNDVPFFVKCVKGIFLGSTAAASVMAGSSPQSRVCPLKRKQSPTGSSANVYGKTPKKDSAVSSSDVDEVSIGGYIEASRSTRYHPSNYHPSTTLDSSPIMNNYLSKKRKIPESSRSQSRTQLQEITAQNGGSLLDTALGLNSGLQGGSQWTPREVLVSCGMNNKSTTLMQRNVPEKSRAGHLMESYSPIQTHIIETDKIMNHYSDAINAKSSQRFRSRPLSRASVATVSKNHDYISEKSNTDFSESDRSNLKTYHRGKTNSIPQRRPNSNRVDISGLGEAQSSPLDTSELLPNKEDFRLPGSAPSADQNSIIASFESMMQQRRPYYVEHCGCRQKKPETVPYNLDISDDNSQENEFGGIKATFQVVTIANDNNSSIDLKCNTVMAHDFPKNQEELCATFCSDNDVEEDHACSEQIVASTVDLEERTAFCDNEDVVKNTDTPDANSRGNHNPYKDADYWNDINDYEEEAEVDYGKSLLKPQASIISGNGERAELSVVDVEITDCREYFSDGISNENESLLLDTDEAESWYKTTEEETDIGNSMKKADDQIIIEETDVDGNVEEEIDEDNDDIDYEQEISEDEDEDDYDNNDSYDYDD